MNADCSTKIHMVFQIVLLIRWKNKCCIDGPRRKKSFGTTEINTRLIPNTKIIEFSKKNQTIFLFPFFCKAQSSGKNVSFLDSILYFLRPEKKVHWTLKIPNSKNIQQPDQTKLNKLKQFISDQYKCVFLALCVTVSEKLKFQKVSTNFFLVKNSKKWANLV